MILVVDHVTLVAVLQIVKNDEVVVEVVVEVEVDDDEVVVEVDDDEVVADEVEVIDVLLEK